MNRTIFAACGAFAIAGLTVTAQSTSTPSSQTTPGSQPGKAMTVTGCLMPYSASGSMGAGSTASGTAGTTGTTAGTATGTTGAAGASQFMLTKIESGSGSSATGYDRRHRHDGRDRH